MAFDLVLSGATIVDPSQQKNGRGDVGITNGRIAAVSDRIEADAHTTIDVSGKFLTPGWIDLHAHVYAGATTFGIKADALCLATGVTTIVDAGSPGWDEPARLSRVYHRTVPDRSAHLRPYQQHWAPEFHARRDGGHQERRSRTHGPGHFHVAATLRGRQGPSGGLPGGKPRR